MNGIPNAVNFYRFLTSWIFFLKIEDHECLMTTYPHPNPNPNLNPSLNHYLNLFPTKLLFALGVTNPFMDDV